VIAQISNLPEEGDAVIDVLVSDDDPPIFLKPPKVRTPTPHTPPLPENSLEHPKDHDVAREGPVQNLLGNEPVAPDRPFDEEGPTICDMERGYTNEGTIDTDELVRGSTIGDIDEAFGMVVSGSQEKTIDTFV